MLKRFSWWFLVIGVCFLAACNGKPGVVSSPAPATLTPTALPEGLAQATPFAPTATALPEASPTPLPPPHLLTICLGREPKSLFWYQASASARSVLQAVYDGPVDQRAAAYQPVILQKAPAQADGEIALLPVEVKPGDWIADAAGNLTALAEGTRYRPAGCAQDGCALAYSGNQPVQMDQMTVRFTLLPGLTWSDGAALTADDSLYSYEVARSLFAAGELDALARTANYQALDETTLEWRGLPGFLTPFPLAYFFLPLPRHAWGNLSPEQLLTTESVWRTPLGWGAYVIDEWASGDHITLHKNPHYFRAAEGLPRFDTLVFRFMADGQEAVEALRVGECDGIDSSVLLDVSLPALQQLQQEGKIVLFYQPDVAWEAAFFGVSSLDPTRPPLFALKEVRQAVALCADRQQIVENLMAGQSAVMDSFIPPSDPRLSAETRRYSFDPAAAASLLQSVGWLDADGDPQTPRTASGVPDVPDGTPFIFTYLAADDAERPAAAQILQQSLAQCGLQMNVEIQPANVYLASGPDGPVFGRRFDMAQVAFPLSVEPACQFFSSDEVPGYAPLFPKSWGGINASGYANPAFDQACLAERFSLPDQVDDHTVQALFAEDLPVLPLYTRFRLAAARPGLCGLDASAAAVLWNLEEFDDAAGCR